MARGRAPNGIGHLMILKSFDNRRFDSRLSKQTTPTACTHPGKVQISYSPCLGNHSGWFSWMDLVSTYILQVRHQPHPWCQQRLQQKSNVNKPAFFAVSSAWLSHSVRTKFRMFLRKVEWSNSSARNQQIILYSSSSNCVMIDKNYYDSCVNYFIDILRNYH